MTSLQNKIDFVLVFAVENANPNGDPLNGNRPRTTSVCRTTVNVFSCSLQTGAMMANSRCRAG